MCTSQRVASVGARLAESASDSAPEEACLFLFDVIILRSFFLDTRSILMLTVDFLAPASARYANRLTRLLDSTSVTVATDFLLVFEDPLVHLDAWHDRVLGGVLS